MSAAVRLAKERLLTLITRYCCKTRLQSEGDTITSSEHKIISVMESNDKRKVVFVTKMEQRSLQDVYQAITDSIGSEFGRVVDVQYLHDIAAMNADRVDANVEMTCDLLI